MSKRLELVWPNKEKLLLGLDDKGKPIWGDKNDLEPRLLVQLKSVGKVNADNPSDLYAQGDNLLIKGDNLLALKSLEQHFAGKIKCIYIDPPFNTGNAFEHYDDGLEHTIWLSMMKARLEILHALLSGNGVIFVHIDNTEAGYLRALMDEIFGVSNFLSQIAYERSGSAGIGQGASFLVNTCEYILVYSKNKLDFEVGTPLIEKDLDREVMKRYNQILEDPGTKTLVREFKARSNKLSVRIFKHRGYQIKSIRLRDFESRKEEILKEYSDYFALIFRTTNPQKENSFQHGLISKMKDGLYSVEYTPSRGKKQNVETTNYYVDRRLCAWLRDSAILESGMVQKTNKMTDFWPHADIPKADLANEGGVEFRRGKKPENLLRRIIDVVTQETDWVLDSFLGSGTTTAVAHKLGRKWIGIEIGEHAETLCLPRLTKVANGKDQTGISKQVGWKGGGGFRYCTLGESLFAKDADTNLVMINPHYNNGLLVQAVCNLENFRLHNDSIFNGVRGNTFAHIAEDKVTQEYLDVLVDQLPEDKSLVVYCLKRANGLQYPDRVQIKRIPKDLQVPRYLTNGEHTS